MKYSRGLIIKKRWLDLILSGHKTWEMRSAKTNVRGPIALIEQGSGLIVGHANLVDSIGPLSTYDYYDAHDKHMIPDTIHNTKWRHAWVLVGAKRHETPIPYAHPKGAVIWVKLGEEQ